LISYWLGGKGAKWQKPLGRGSIGVGWGRKGCVFRLGFALLTDALLLVGSIGWIVLLLLRVLRQAGSRGLWRQRGSLSAFHLISRAGIALLLRLALTTLLLALDLLAVLIDVLGGDFGMRRLADV
jgi:hypothetical protein